MSYIPNPLIIPVGIAVGIVVSAPVGPVNVLCIQRVLQRGVVGGVTAGLGAVLGDGLIAFAAAMGIGAIDSMVSYYRSAIQAIGGFVLVLFGAMLCLSTVPEPVEDKSEHRGQFSDYLGDVPKAFLMTVTNPGAVLGLFAIFGGIGTFVEVRGAVDALVLVGAIMAGSLIWWVILSVLVGQIRGRLGTINIARVNLIAGLALVAFGFVLLGEIAFELSRQALFLTPPTSAGLL